METTYSELNIVDRSIFDRIPDSSKINNIYVVREGTKETSKIMTLYYEDKRQCDILDITDLAEVDFNDPQNNYNIPQEYQIANKMLMAVQTVTDSLGNDTIFYHVFCWNGEKFVDCFGTPNNVIVCNLLPSNPTKGMIYLSLSTQSLHFFDGSSYINIISSDKYATVDYVNDIYNNLIADISELGGNGGGLGLSILTLFGAQSGSSGATIILEELI